jgi:phage terminase small subunit
VAAPRKGKAKPAGKDAPLKKLTPSQRLFADYVIEGRQKSEAYAAAYPQSSLNRTALSVEAYRTAKLPHVADYIAEALSERRNEVLLTRDKKRQILGSIALDTRKPAHARIMAVNQDNLMTGDHKPVRVEGEITLHSIFAALVKSTGLPGADEAKAISGGEARTVAVDALPVAADVADELVPAMERRRHA